MASTVTLSLVSLIQRQDHNFMPSTQGKRNLLPFKSSFSGAAFNPASLSQKFCSLTSYSSYPHPFAVQAKKSSPAKAINKSAKSTRSQRLALDYSQILRYPIVSEAGIKNITQNNTLVFAVEKRADKRLIKDAATNIFKIQIKKVNTCIMPDGTKKAFLMLKSDCSAGDVAKRIKAI
ncbi:unnamed protein product [Cuscuta campestris]|uniref:Ribosomal protein L23/L25 N-terminal domain-containing protein n=1 Tax=Cuscuta campestris TaxID=132261 RepID=A0A484NF11_9ASTE|nr:unnamed protein product [Cuscuta campestris]